MNLDGRPPRGQRKVGWDVRGWALKRRPRDRYAYVGFRACVHPINAVGDTLGRPIHRVEVTASPTGKNVHVFVDGVPYVPEAAQR